MKKTIFGGVIVTAALIVGIIYYRHHHPVHTVGAHDASVPFSPAQQPGNPSNAVGNTQPYDPSHPPTPTPIHSTSLDHTMETVRQVNDINRFNQQQTSKKTPDRQQ